MARQADKQRTLSRRAFVLGGLQLLGFTALAGRLYYLQFIRSEEYTTLAENNRIKLQLIAPERGQILDKNGQALAVNEQNYQLFADAAGLNRAELTALLSRVSAFVPLSEKRQQQLLEEFKANPFAPLLLREHLSWEEVASIELRQMELPDVYIHVGQVRSYPFADHSAHLIGYVGAVAPEELTDQPLLRLPDFKIGKSGVEKMLEDDLRGTAGIRQVEVNVHGLPVRELETKESIPGENVTLTLDNRLQDFTAGRVKDESASVIVMDIENGDVLTLVSMPAFDPNIFSKGIPSDYWDELHDNERKPLVNKAIQGQYPPGSTFKMIVGLAGLEEGSISGSTHVFCPGHFMLGNHRFNCWKEGGHGTVDIHEALAQSCDTFFYTVAERTGIEPIARMARMFGLGEEQGLGLIGEQGGLIPDPDWKLKRYKQRWQTGDTINAGIGQGYVLATPLQLAVMVARLAAGTAVKPRLVAAKESSFLPLNVKEEHLTLIHSGMEAVVSSSSGTAYSRRITQPEFAFAGKTGTSQVRKIITRGMKQELLPWNARHHALFVGYAPVHAPKYAACVAVEHGGGGAAAAAPIAHDVLLKVQELNA